MSEDFLIPKHVAIILDGNRRFAKKSLIKLWKGHECGRKKVEELLDYAKEFGVREITFYCLSNENLKNRSLKELNYLFDLFKKTFKEIDIERLNREGVKLKFIGDLDLLPVDLKEICGKLEGETFENNDFVVNFALAYGGRQEIVRAVKKIIDSNISNVNEKIIEENLYLKSEPDLIIRTGGEKRTSNFLIWQSVYSEWIFLDKMWPEFCREDFKECVEEFGRRKRNFGK